MDENERRLLVGIFLHLSLLNWGDKRTAYAAGPIDEYVREALTDDERRLLDRLAAVPMGKAP